MKTKHFNHIISIAGVICFLILAVGSEGDSSEEDSASTFQFPKNPEESQVAFLDELDRRLSEYKKRETSVGKIMSSSSGNPYKNPGVNWNEYHNFLYEQVKWLTNTSYNEFYKSDVNNWQAKVIEVSEFEGRYEILCDLGEFRLGDRTTKVGFGLLTYSRGVVSTIDAGNWVQFSGSWNTVYDKKPIGGSYEAGETYYGDNSKFFMSEGWVRTEKDIGRLDGDRSKEAKKPEQSRAAERLLNKLYNSDSFYNEPDIIFYIDVGSITMQ